MADITEPCPLKRTTSATARIATTRTSSTPMMDDGRLIGCDPDPNVRQSLRDEDWYFRYRD